MILPNSVLMYSSFEPLVVASAKRIVGPVEKEVFPIDTKNGIRTMKPSIIAP
jgi:hypothetical protein